MSQLERFSFIPKISIRPDKIVVYNQVIRNRSDLSTYEQALEKANEKKQAAESSEKKRAVENNKHQFQISAKASTRIKEKVTWLYELARNKTVTTNSGKILDSFKMNFITLTLPSVQVHSSAVITSECLNQFITECRTKHKMENYVWRLEYQKNGNIHYHIATDTYIDYNDCKLLWNRCIRKLGYINAYSQEFSKLSFNQYCERVNKSGKIDFYLLKERYGRGCATRWDSPNTVDVRAVSNAKNIAFYISKYITKNQPIAVSETTINRDSDVSNLRLWFCSRSLSKLDKIAFFIEEGYELAEKAIKLMTDFKFKLFDYCKVWYYSTKNQSNECRNLFWQLFRNYSLETGYTPA